MELINDDCLTYLKNVNDNSIDCCITDPPYFIDKLDTSWNFNKINNRINNSHITHLPKGMKFSKEQSKNLYNFYKDFSSLVYQKLKPGGFFLSFSSPRLYHSIASACDDSGFEIRDMINWIYLTTFPKGMSILHLIKKMKITEEEKQILLEKYKNYKTPMIRSNHEPICVAMKPISTTFLQNELINNTGLIDFSQKVGIEKNKVPSNVITCNDYDETFTKNFLVSKPNKKEKGDFNTHITVKPLQLMEHLVKLFTKENSIVLDPFMGSGTTGLACKNTNRKFIGIEINNEYYLICKKRIES